MTITTVSHDSRVKSFFTNGLKKVTQNVLKVVTEPVSFLWENLHLQKGKKILLEESFPIKQNLLDDLVEISIDRPPTQQEILAALDQMKFDPFVKKMNRYQFQNKYPSIWTQIILPIPRSHFGHQNDEGIFNQLLSSNQNSKALSDQLTYYHYRFDIDDSLKKKKKSDHQDIDDLILKTANFIFENSDYIGDPSRSPYKVPAFAAKQLSRQINPPRPQQFSALFDDVLGAKVTFVEKPESEEMPSLLNPQPPACPRKFSALFDAVIADSIEI